MRQDNRFPGLGARVDACRGGGPTGRGPAKPPRRKPFPDPIAPTSGTIALYRFRLRILWYLDCQFAADDCHDRRLFGLGQGAAPSAFYRHTELAGSSFDFHGSPSRILAGRVIALVMLVAYNYSVRLRSPLTIVIVVGIAALMPWLLRNSFRFRLYNTSCR
jgi:Bacterial protein of unknown function (DUF898)